ncbi:SF1B family DNA helicase RecD2 [Desulfothermus sp.]
MDTLKGEVVSVVYTDPETHFTVARLKSKQEPGLITVVGNIGAIAPGTELSLEGNWKFHPKFGRQFNIVSCVQNLPATIVGIKRYLSSGLVKGIGPVLAERMIKHFGNNALKVLDESPDKLLEVPGIGKKTLEKIVSSWDEQKEIRNVILFLQEHAIPPSFAVRIYRTYGKDSLKTIREKPYDLAYEVKGIGFKSADKIALKLGFSEYSIERIEAAIVYALFSLSEKGHVFYPKEGLISHVMKLLNLEDTKLVEDAIRLLLEKKRIYIEDIDENIKDAVYLRHFYKWEVEIASRLKGIMSCATHQAEDSEKISGYINDFEKRYNISLSEEQREAILGACLNQVFIITGGPGTGKTTITRFIGHILKKMGLKIKLAAPTGRAAKRLQEATGLFASTIHRMLGFGPGGEFQYREDKKIKINALILDEVSMVDCHLFVNLLRALPLTCKLILIGDVNQLPSVGPGNVLKDLIESQVIPTKGLSKIYRQAKKSMIVVNAHRINQGKFPVRSKKEPPEADFFWVEEEDPKKVQQLIIHMVSQRIPKVYGFDPMKEVQVLTPMHKGDIGTAALNKLLQDTLNSSNKAKTYVLKGFRLGDRVIQTKNNYEKEVFNGDLGIIREVDLESGELIIDFDGRDVLYNQSELDEISLAYCISIHKSQGSEYPVVLFPVMVQHYIMLHKNLVYTALTRAKKLAVIFGSRKAMAIALKDVNKEHRYTNLKNRLKDMAIC